MLPKMPAKVLRRLFIVSSGSDSSSSRAIASTVPGDAGPEGRGAGTCWTDCGADLLAENHMYRGEFRI